MRRIQHSVQWPTEFSIQRNILTLGIKPDEEF